MDNKLDEIIRSLNELKKSHNKLVSLVNSHTDKLSNIASKVDDLAQRLDLLSADNETLKHRVLSLENNVKTIVQNDSSPVIDNNLIKEMIERQARQKNVLLFNVIETAEGSNSNDSDMSTILEIFKYLQINTQITHISRLGNFSTPSNRPRPIKIILQNQSDAFQIFSTQNKLKLSENWKDLRFTSDQTKMQRDFMSKLRVELLHRRSNGEPNLIIKYFKGTPIITNPKN